MTRSFLVKLIYLSITCGILYTVFVLLSTIICMYGTVHKLSPFQTSKKFNNPLFFASAASSFTITARGGFLVQRSIRGRAAEMGLKISLLVLYDDPLIQCKNWYKLGSYFQNYLNLNWRESRPNFINLIPKFPKFA